MLFRVLLFTILTIPVLNAGNKNLKVQGVYGCLNNAIGNGTVITAILSDSYKKIGRAHV